MEKTFSEFKPYTNTIYTEFNKFINWFDIDENQYTLSKKAPRNFILVNSPELINNIDEMCERLMVLKSFIPGHYISTEAVLSKGNDDSAIVFDKLKITTEHKVYDLFEVCAENENFNEIFNHLITENLQKMLSMYILSKNDNDTLISVCNDIQIWVDKLFKLINILDNEKVTTVCVQNLTKENMKLFLNDVIPVANELVGRTPQGEKVEFNYESDIIVRLSTDNNKNFKHTVFSEGFGMQHLTDSILLNMLILK